MGVLSLKRVTVQSVAICLHTHSSLPPSLSLSALWKLVCQKSLACKLNLAAFHCDRCVNTGQLYVYLVCVCVGRHPASIKHVFDKYCGKIIDLLKHCMYFLWKQHLLTQTETIKGSRNIMRSVGCLWLPNVNLSAFTCGLRNQSLELELSVL